MSAHEIHERLEAALRELKRAERNAVLLFTEIMRRGLYRDLGYATIQLYAAGALGFSRSKTSQFVLLAGTLEDLPRLRDSIATGKLGWTKAREVAKVATPASESRWPRRGPPHEQPGPGAQSPLGAQELAGGGAG